MESTSGEAALKIVDIRTKDWESYKNLVDRAPAESEGVDANFERSSTVGKILPTSIAYYRKIICERKSQSMWQTSLLSWSLSSHQHQDRTFHEQKDVSIISDMQMTSPLW